MSNPIKLLVTFLLSGASLYLFVSIQWSTRYKIAATILLTCNSNLRQTQGYKFGEFIYGGAGVVGTFN